MPNCLDGRIGQTSTGTEIHLLIFLLMEVILNGQTWRNCCWVLPFAVFHGPCCVRQLGDS